MILWKKPLTIPWWSPFHHRSGRRQADVDDGYLTGDDSDYWEDCDDKIYACDYENSREKPGPATPDPFKP